MTTGASAPWALILAAGASRRFGSDKLAASAAGRPLIEWTVTTLQEARSAGLIDGIMAVVRAPDRMQGGAVGSGIERVVLPAGSAPALADTLKAGIAALARHPANVSAVLICLADQPGLRVDVIGQLVAEWRQPGARPVLRPRYHDAPDEPGHPVLLDRSQWGLVAEAVGDAGLGPLLAQRPELVQFVDVEGDNPDVDRPEDLTRFGA